ncbi:4905_t:CDS:1 [Scutellospora calospora]|uniref:4905_t:CDS:1 n=1 Tax=Scutellospora calospora TaxID=85575 RepID=A0ACA9MGP8_9GLOM|nr:4905_t:CDS:1 [Scutellospora calospora]
MKGSWQVTEEVNHQALTRAFPEQNECLEFIQKLKKYFFIKNEIYSEIESKLPKNRKHKLYPEVQNFKKDKFNWPKKGAVIDYQKLCKSEEEIIEEFQDVSETESDSEESDDE